MLSYACSLFGPSLDDLKSERDLADGVGSDSGAGGNLSDGASGDAARCNGPCEPAQIITGESALGSMVARNGYLAWTAGQTLRSCQSRNCLATVRTLVTDPPLQIESRLAVAVDDARIFFGGLDLNDTDTHWGYTIGFDGEGGQTFGFVAEPIAAFVGEGANGYVAVGNGGPIKFCTRSCNPYISEWTTVSSTAAPVVAMVLSPTKIYWLRGGSSGALYACPKGGCAGGAAPPEELGGLLDPQGLVVDSAGVTVTVHGDGRVLQCPLLGCAGTPSTVATQATASAPYGIASTGDTLVWANEGEGTVVESTALGSTPNVIARIDRPRFVALDGADVFVTSAASNSIYRVVR